MLLLATHAMGTRFEFVLQGEDEGHLRAVGEEAIRVVEDWHGRVSRFEPGSDASRLNRDGAARVDSEMRELLELCERVRVESDGAFDVRCGEGGMLDFGAVGKGWALDRAAEVVRECGVRCALLHGGTSSVVGIGAPEGAEGWKVGVRSEGEGMEVMLKDAAMGVSAPRGFRGEGSSDAVAGAHGLAAPCHGFARRFAGQPVMGTGGERLSTTSDGCCNSTGCREARRTRGTRTGSTGVESHIVDPRTGMAVSGVDTAVVVVRDGGRHACAMADAWSTALVVLGGWGGRGERMSEGFDSYVHTERGWESHLRQKMGAA